MHEIDGYTYNFSELVKQKTTDFLKKVVEVLTLPVQLSIFDTSELTTVGVSITKQSTTKS
ncbi:MULTISPECIES: hypothetical protein [unclassified Okeania]|uniref:hypothetical protein n=1 Tax=unclassified Okeania TaxID=2634635 RepID=UPI0013B76938|nr:MULTISPECIES: hypothetical protein [unclassified Okeania]NES67945.1 hypothetical protein [Okeania sp. SIO2D1]NEP87927.1 hypothetical protein [Okeania sp. SIO2C2]NEQ75723.1 hypothetical protein [Okeania sp. SIO2C9]NES79675.1 hypothetical protein [Okeania sp. SIO1H4]NET23332.1 hypothetical protein [Okeania sp. SIO1H5]